MIKMTHPVALPRSEFGPFLYALVGEEESGMPLSVLSTLARRNLDPWQEANELAALPVEIAKKRLALVIEGLPSMTGRLDVGKTADRLMTLLPTCTGSDAAKSPIPPGGREQTTSILFMWIIAVGLMLGAQAIAVIREPPEKTQAPASTSSVNPEPNADVGSGQ